MSEQERVCSACGKTLPWNDEYFHRSGIGLHTICKTCRCKAKAIKLQENLILARNKKREETQRLRLRVVTHYSNGIPTCACCGEQTIQFLALDHINGGGAKHRREENITGSSVFRWIIRNGFPAIFQVLCHNCNLAKGFYGECPHETERKREDG